MSSNSSKTISKSAGHGSEHWWRQRFTAIGVAVLGILLICGLLSTLGQPYEVAVSRFKSPLCVTAGVLFVLLMFYHAALGLQVVIEDYVSTVSLRTALIVLVQMLCLFFATAGVVSLISLMF